MNRNHYFRAAALLSAAWMLLFPALLFPAAAHAQNDNCIITVANGTATNSYVPVYGFYCDNYLRCQILYPASKIREGQFMTDVTHGQYTNVIRSMTFHLASPAAGSWGNALFVMRIKEIPLSVNTIGSSYWDMSDATVVYSDSLNAMGETMLVNFSLGMTYGGGNLLVEIENTAIGTYKSCSWYGESYAGASLSGYSSTSVAACSATSRNFLPKTTIIFENTGLATDEGTAVTVGDESSSATSYTYPVNNYYNYSLSETIIDQGELDGPGTIRSLSLKYTASTPMTAKGDVTLWIQPTAKSTFASADDIELLNASTAVKVYQGPLNCAQGWNEFVLTTPYDYDGSGNLMIIVDDNSGDYNGILRTFATAPSSGNKTLAWFSDNVNPAPTSGSFSGTKNVYNSRVLMRVNKENPGSVLKYVDFHDGTVTNNLWTGTGYSTGVVTSGTEQHGQSAAYSYWQRIAGTGAAAQSTVSALFPYFYSRLFSWDHFVGNLDAGVSSADNGYMMMSLMDQRADQTGNFNAYINLGVVNASQAPVVDVRLFQYYKKYYDHCYIDWRTSSTGAWNSMEINALGEDVEVNGFLLGFRTYTLPLAAAGQGYLELRLRYTSLDSHLGNGYGYYWIVDDVSVLAGEADRMVARAGEFVYEAYGIKPPTMKFKPTWYGRVENNGANTQTDVTVELLHKWNDSENLAILGSCNNGAIPPTTAKALVFDPHGWLDPDNLDYRGWDSYAAHTEPDGPFAYLPNNSGDNYVFAHVSSQEGVHCYRDTILYRVSDPDNATGAYLWAKDNGVLTYAKHYLFGNYRSGNNWYVSEDASVIGYDRPGYQLTMRYTTGLEVPQGWVIRGMELVAAPDSAYQDAVRIRPLLTRDDYDGENVSFRDIVTGAGVHRITPDELNADALGGDGYRELGDYNTIRILFPEQPELTPYTSYRVGYELVDSGSFAVAASSTYCYRNIPGGLEALNFRTNPDTRKYTYTVHPNQYDVVARDPQNPRVLFASCYKDELPLIRLLVGPAQPVNRVNIEVRCEGEGNIFYGDDLVCGSTVTPVEGSTAEFSIRYNTRYAYIYLDGELIAPADARCEQLEEDLLRLTLPDMTGDRVLRVLFSDEVGIDEVENIKVSAYPNPTCGLLTVSASENITLIEVFGVNGTLVRSLRCSGNSADVDLSDLQAGTYMLSVHTSIGIAHERVVVK